MSFRPTSILEWILLGYGAVALVVALILAPLVIGLGDDNANSSPLSVVRFGGGFSLGSGASRRSRSRRKARARHRRPVFKRAAASVPDSDPCKVAIARMISCTQDEKVKKLLSNRKDRFISECRKRNKDVRKAERCAKRSSCKAFERCLSGS